MKIKNTIKPLITFMLLLVTIMTVVIIAAMILKPNGSFIPTDKQISEEDPLYKNKVLDKPTNLKATEIEDYKDLLYMSIGEVYNQKYYNTKSYGNTKANSFIGTFEQEISGYKIIYEDDVFSESLSKGSVVSVAKQRFIDLKNGYYLIRDGKLKTLKDVSWKEIKKISKNDFMNMYGNTFKDFSQYIFNDESIQSVELIQKDENSVTIKVVLKIDPKSHDNLAVARYKREIKTMSGSSNFPNFLGCEIEIKIANDFKILKTISREKYIVDKIGNPTCETIIYQDFYYEKKEIELKKEYEKYFNSDNDENKDKKPSEILFPAFADLYLNKASFDLEAFNQEFKGEINLKNLNLYIQNKNLDLLIDNSGLYFKYDGKSYKFDSKILSQLGINNNQNSNSTANILNKIKDILATIDDISEVEKIENGFIINTNLLGIAEIKTTILNDVLSKIEISAKINGKEEKLVLQFKNNPKINRTTFENPFDITSKIKISEDFVFAKLFENIKSKLEILKKLNLNVDLIYKHEDTELKINGIVSILDKYADLNIVVTNPKFEVKLEVIVNNDKVYVKLNDKIYEDSFKNITNLIKQLLKDNNISSETTNINNISIDKILNIFENITLGNDFLNVTTNYLDLNFNLNNLTLNLAGKDINLNGSVVFLENITKKEITEETIQIDSTKIAELIENTYKLLLNKQNSFDINLQFNDILLNGKVSYDLDQKRFKAILNIPSLKIEGLVLEYVEEKVYITFQNNKLVFSKQAIERIINQVNKQANNETNNTLNNILGILPNKFNINELIKLINFKNNTLTLETSFGNITLSDKKILIENLNIQNNLINANVLFNEETVEFDDVNEVEFNNLDELLNNITVDEQFNFNEFYNLINQKLSIYKNLSGELNLTYQTEDLTIKSVGKVSYKGEKLYVEADLEIETKEIKVNLHVIMNEKNIYVTFNNHKYYDTFDNIKNAIPKVIELINKVTNKQITNPISNEQTINLDIMSIIKEIKLVNLKNNSLTLNHKYGNAELDLNSDKLTFNGLDKLNGITATLNIKEIEKVNNFEDYTNLEINNLLEKINRIYQNLSKKQNTVNVNLNINNQQITGTITYDNENKLYYLDLTIGKNNIKLYLENNLIKVIYGDKYFEANKLLVLNLVKQVFKEYQFIQNLDLDNLGNIFQLPLGSNKPSGNTKLDLNKLLTRLNIAPNLIDVVYDNIEIKLENENKLIVNNLVVENTNINGVIELLEYNPINVPNHQYDNLDEFLQKITIDENTTFKTLFKNIKKTFLESNYNIDLELLNEEGGQNNLIIKGSGVLSLKGKIYLELTVNIKINNLEATIKLFYKDNKIYVHLPSKWEELTTIISPDKFIDIINRVIAITSLNSQPQGTNVTSNIEILSKIKNVTIGPNNLTLSTEYFDAEIDTLNPNMIITKDKLRVNVTNTDAEIEEKGITPNVHYEDLDNLVRSAENILSLQNNYDNQYTISGTVYEKNEKVYEYTGSIQTDFKHGYDLLIDAKIIGTKEGYGNHEAKFIIKNNMVYGSYKGKYSKEAISFKLSLIEFKKSAKVLLNFMNIKGKLFDALFDVNVDETNGGLFNSSTLIGEGKTINLNDIIKSYKLITNENNDKIAKFVLDVKDLFNNQTLKDYYISINNGKDIINQVDLNDFYTSENTCFNMSIKNENKPSEIVVNENDYKHNFENIYELVLGATKSASLRKYHLKGDIYFDFPSPVKDIKINDFDLKIKLNEDNKPLVRAEMTIPYHYFWLFGYKYITNGETKLIVYFKDNMIYVDQIFRLWGKKPPQHTHYELTKEQFDNNKIDEIFRMINAGDYLKEQMANQSGGNNGSNTFDINKIFKSYFSELSGDKRIYKIVLDGQELANSNQVRDIRITMSTLNDFLKKLNVFTNVGPKGAFSIDINANLSIENTEDPDFDFTLPDFTSQWWR